MFYFRMTSSFPTVTSAPPNIATTRTMSNNQLHRTSTMNSNQQASSRFKTTYDSRRYTNLQTPYKRASQPPVPSNSKTPQALSRIEQAQLSSARLVLQQQLSSPSRLQSVQRQSSSSPQFATQVNPVLDPLNIGRHRPTPLPPPAPRNGIQRNALSLNALPVNHHNGTATRGRSQNSAHKSTLTNRTTKARQHSLAQYDLQHHPAQFPSTAVLYQHPLNTDQPPVFFE